MHLSDEGSESILPLSHMHAGSRANMHLSDERGEGPIHIGWSNSYWISHWVLANLASKDSKISQITRYVDIYSYIINLKLLTLIIKKMLILGR